ncbi:hypothetical protein JTE90_006079 [Oedothorax gibbosus]|uniref:Uncharacterized protein n=1 Tax=Oedothorax gibbosus TaxID=931172 RepID=A0AAV6V5I1_9ARAC|nr:hypothetical protein JTE90_006079 [Oedothorax gibbosus]
MTSRLFQQVYRGLVTPLVTPKTNFPPNTGSLMSTTTGSPKSSSNNDMAMNVLKIGGGFAVGMYTGHVVTEQGIVPMDKMYGKDTDKEEEDKSEDKDKGKEAEDKGEEAKDAAKDK